MAKLVFTVSDESCSLNPSSSLALSVKFHLIDVVDNAAGVPIVGATGGYTPKLPVMATEPLGTSPMVMHTVPPSFATAV